mmetsp:Transcript_1474/g.3008  ORF Transcript_1474/g.3008 Transcript_1474/m.3008 type:complete len:232 (+) Transcript_1474:67-762(+)
MPTSFITVNNFFHTKVLHSNVSLQNTISLEKSFRIHSSSGQSLVKELLALCRYINRFPFLRQNECGHAIVIPKVSLLIGFISMDFVHLGVVVKLECFSVVETMKCLFILEENYLAEKGDAKRPSARDERELAFADLLDFSPFVLDVYLTIGTSHTNYGFADFWKCCPPVGIFKVLIDKPLAFEFFHIDAVDLCVGFRFYAAEENGIFMMFCYFMKRLMVLRTSIFSSSQLL